MFSEEKSMRNECGQEGAQGTTEAIMVKGAVPHHRGQRYTSVRELQKRVSWGNGAIFKF